MFRAASVCELYMIIEQFHAGGQFRVPEINRQLLEIEWEALPEKVCRTDFADIQIKKNVEVTDNGKIII